MTNQLWDNMQYRRMDSAEHHHGNVHVRFENGDEVDVETARLLLDGARAPDWDQLRCDGIELEVPTQAGPKYVFWETIRELTDPAYATRLDDADAAYRRQTGDQIRKLRVSRGLTGKHLATLASINNQSLSRIENGRRGITLTTLRRILNAMGYTLTDMVLDPTESEEDTTVATHAVR